MRESISVPTGAGSPCLNRLKIQIRIAHIDRNKSAGDGEAIEDAASEWSSPIAADWMERKSVQNQINDKITANAISGDFCRPTWGKYCSKYRPIFPRHVGQVS